MPLDQPAGGGLGGGFSPGSPWNPFGNATFMGRRIFPGYQNPRNAQGFQTNIFGQPYGNSNYAVAQPQQATMTLGNQGAIPMAAPQADPAMNPIPGRVMDPALRTYGMNKNMPGGQRPWSRLASGWWTDGMGQFQPPGWSPPGPLPMPISGSVPPVAPTLGAEFVPRLTKRGYVR